MTLAVHISPPAETIPDDNGIGRVIHAQHRYLPEHGIAIVEPDQADLLVCHIQQGSLPRVDVLHTHGLYWSGDKGSGVYQAWHHEANSRIIAAARRARAVTVPSPWVAEPFLRDMRMKPHVIGHGIDLEDWEPASEHKGYLLWNKNRVGDVCSPLAAFELARRGFEVVSTFAPSGILLPDTMHITGLLPHVQMRALVTNAEVYLATTKETFGIGTLEALAAGVPVLGYRWGGTADLVEHEVNGYLVEPGDIDGLHAGIVYIRTHRAELAANARERARGYTWQTVIAQYAALYQRVFDARREEQTGVSVVITNYNYGAYINEAIRSILDQTVSASELLVVDDGSSDNSAALLESYESHPLVRVLRQHNQGVAAARNLGIRESRYPYIVCLDADDKLDPRFLETLLPAMHADRGLGIAYSGLGIIQEGGNVTPNAWPPDFSWDAQATPHNPPTNCIPSACLFRRAMWERAGGYRQVYAPGEDTEFFTRGLSVGFTAQRITDLPLFHYRIHDGSASRSKPYRLIDTWHPWMRDREYPMGAPSIKAPPVRSYSQPLISIVIPVGPGHVQYLPAALDSLLGQTFRDWEVIVIDDNDEIDPPRAERDQWQEVRRVYPFARFNWYDGKHGPAAARNWGILTARAPLLLFLDADDYLLPHALLTMLHAYARGGGKYIYSDWYRLSDDGQMVAHQTPEYRQVAWMETGQHAITALLPTEEARHVGGFDESMAGWEDWDFFIKLAIHGVCGLRIPQPLLVYRQHTGTIREKSLGNKDGLLSTLRERYAGYAMGDETMAGCGGCGASAGPLLRAKQALEGLPDMAMYGLADEPKQQGPQTVRMQFIGRRVGSVRFNGGNGRYYRGGNNPDDRYIDAHIDDVAFLESTQDWRVLARIPEVLEHAPVIEKDLVV